MKQQETSSKGKVKGQLKKLMRSNNTSKAARFSLALMSGMVPFVGGALEGLADAWSEIENERFRKVMKQWMDIQEAEIQTSLKLFMKSCNGWT